MRGFFLILLLAISSAVAAQDAIQDTVTAVSDSIQEYNSYNSNGYNTKETTARPDSSNIEVRSFNNKTLEELRKNDDFDYRQPPTVAESLWDRFLQWLAELFGWIINGAVGTDWGRVFMYILGITVIVVIVMMVLKVDALRVFYSGSDKGTLNYQTFQENIHEMNFDSLIQEALIKKEYRNAVRLTFLYALKLLSDKQHVDWRPGKTNHDYIEELKKADLKVGFNELSFYFDYAWYGEFNVNEAMYQRVHIIFDNWRKKVE